MSAVHDPGLRVVARVRAVRERDSRHRPGHRPRRGARPPGPGSPTSSSSCRPSARTTAGIDLAAFAARQRAVAAVSRGPGRGPGRLATARQLVAAGGPRPLARRPHPPGRRRVPARAPGRRPAVERRRRESRELDAGRRGAVAPRPSQQEAQRMSVTDVTSRISQIQAQLALLGPARTNATSAARSPTCSADARRQHRPRPSAGTGDGRRRRRRGQEVPRRPLRLGRHRPEEGPRLLGPGPARLQAARLRPAPGVLPAGRGRPRRSASLAQAQPGDLIAWTSAANGVHHIAHLHRRRQDDRGAAPRRRRPDQRRLRAPGRDPADRPRRRVRPPSAPPAARRPAGCRRARRTPTSSTRRPRGTASSATLLVGGRQAGVGLQPAGRQPRRRAGADAADAGHRARPRRRPTRFDPAQAVDGAARLLSSLLDRFGSTDLALAAYNAGPGAVLRYDGIPPYAETQNYVRSVMAMWKAS